MQVITLAVLTARAFRYTLAFPDIGKREQRTPCVLFH